ncbi:MAG: GntR family transcriptional regulator [Actinomycetota bacterium]
MTKRLTASRARVAAPLRQEITELLREAIVEGDFEPGDRLRERELCLRFEVSRTVVRESLRQLESEGLVETMANHGPVVAVLRPEDVTALYQVRGALEGLAAELFAAHATKEDHAALKSALAEVETALKSQDPRVWLAAKDGFYDVLFEGSHNSIIGTMVRGLHARMRQLRRVSLGVPGRRPQTLAELKEIVNALERGDAEEARNLATDHVRIAHDIAVQELKRQEISDE